jgi:hypothetical protein
VKLTAKASWECEYQDAKVYEWRVYSSSSRESLGQLVATVQADARAATWDIDDDDGPGYVRVVAATKAGVEDDWAAPTNPISDLRIDTLTTPAALPDVVAAAPVESSMVGRVTLEAPPATDPPAYLQVIEGSDPATGKVIAEVPVVASGPQGADGAHQVSADFPLEGPPDSDKVITVRAVTSGGKPSPTSSTRTMRTPPLEGFHPVTLASIAGATHTGFPAPASTDGHEYDATDGLRARQIPVDYTTMGSTWGYFGDLAGLFSRQPAGSRYIAEFTVESDEFDLGQLYTFRLAIVDTFQRKAAAGFFGSMPFDALAYYPFDPIRDTRVIGTPDGPAWVGREFATNGTPRQGVRRIRWEYVIGTAPGVAHTNADYRPWTATQWCRGRYGRVRAVIVEPAGLHRVVCPAAQIVAYLPRAVTVQVGAPEGATQAPPGHRVVATSPDIVDYVKVTGIDNTGYKPSSHGVGDRRLMAPPGLMAINGIDATAFASGESYAVYLGRAWKDNPTFDVVVEVTQAAATITWAEVAIASGLMLAGLAPSLTTRGFVSVAATFNTTGLKTTTVTTTGVKHGDDVWLILASNATTPFQVRACIPDILQSGVFCSKAATRPSTMAASSAFPVGGTTVVPPRVAVGQK